MKLLVDMNLAPRWVAYLGEAQFHSEHWSNIGSAQAVDAEIMAYAAEHDYVVLTNDLDFGAILAATHRGKPSVIQIRSRNLDHAVTPGGPLRYVVTGARRFVSSRLRGRGRSPGPLRLRLREGG